MLNLNKIGTELSREVEIPIYLLGTVPKEVKYPYITVQTVDESTGRLLQCFEGEEYRKNITTVVQFDIRALKPFQANQILDDIRWWLQLNKRDDGIEVIEQGTAKRLDHTDTDKQIFRISFDVTFNHTEVKRYEDIEIIRVQGQVNELDEIDVRKE